MNHDMDNASSAEGPIQTLSLYIRHPFLRGKKKVRPQEGMLQATQIGFKKEGNGLLKGSVGSTRRSLRGCAPPK